MFWFPVWMIVEQLLNNHLIVFSAYLINEMLNYSESFWNSWLWKPKQGVFNLKSLEIFDNKYFFAEEIFHTHSTVFSPSLILCQFFWLQVSSATLMTNATTSIDQRLPALTGTGSNHCLRIFMWHAISDNNICDFYN